MFILNLQGCKRYDRTSDICIKLDTQSKLFWRNDNAFPMPTFIPITNTTIDFWLRYGSSIYYKELQWFEDNVSHDANEYFMDRWFG